MLTKKALTLIILSSSVLPSSISSACSLSGSIFSDVADICGKAGARMTLTNEREITYLE